MITSSKESTKKSFDEIKEGWKGGYTPLKTRFDHLNTHTHGGLTKQKIYTIGALSSFGKSHTLRQIETDIFDEELNPNSKEDVILVKCDFEMSKMEYVLTKVHAKTDVDFESLMYDKPSATVQQAFDEVYEELTSDYIYETFDSYSPTNFFNDVKEFVDKFQDKKQIVLTIDNINLIENEGGNEGAAISMLIAHLIKLKREVKNLTIIILAQLNRELKQRTDKKEHFPRTSDFYYSSKIEHASDIQIIIHNPFLLGIDEYGTVNSKKYEYLEKYLIPKTGKNYSMFRTEGLVFWHYLKVRLKNNLKDFKDIYVEQIFEVDEVEEFQAFNETPDFGNKFEEKDDIPF